MGETTIPASALKTFFEALDKGNVRIAEQFPGTSNARQPVHTVYGGAHLFSPDIPRKLGATALRSLQEHAPDAKTLAAALGIGVDLADRVYMRVIDKLTREPVEDYRIDFEDGFGSRSEEEEDRYALSTADAVATGVKAGSLPQGIGIRVKSLGEVSKKRSLRTLDLFLTRLVEATRGNVPAGFVVTLPKVTAPEHVAAMASACDAFEYWRELPHGLLRFEIMVETPQAIFSPDGTVALPKLIAEGGGRVVAAHFGPYDYTAACGITAAHQQARHPACDFARNVMQVSLAGTDIWLADGPIQVMPVGHRDQVHRAWRLHAEQVRHALINGWYQGWDLHPAQLPSRFAAVYAFFLEGLDAASTRLRNFLEQAARATMSGNVFDDAASVQGLLNFFLRALNCGAITPAEAVQLSGLSLEALQSRRFTPPDTSNSHTD